MSIRFVFASSCSVYGRSQEMVVTEDSETFPQTPYSLNKLQIEQDLASLSDAGFQPIILRFATVFGLSPRMRFDVVVNMLVGMALTTGRIVLNSNGRAWRPHVHIEDVCEAIRRCLTLPISNQRLLTLNVGDTQQNFLVLDVAEMVRRCVPGCRIEFLNAAGQMSQPDLEALVRDQKIQDGVDTRSYRVSFDRIARVLSGFRCRWTLERGIQDLVERLRALDLTEAQFTDPRFYRLQTLEALFQSGRLTAAVRWTSPVEPAGSTASAVRSCRARAPSSWVRTQKR